MLRRCHAKCANFPLNRHTVLQNIASIRWVGWMYSAEHLPALNIFFSWEVVLAIIYKSYCKPSRFFRDRYANKIIFLTHSNILFKERCSRNSEHRDCQFRNFVTINPHFSRLRDRWFYAKNEIPRRTLKVPRFRDSGWILRDFRFLRGPFATPNFGAADWKYFYTTIF